MRYATLHAPDGREVYVNPDSVEFIRAPVGAVIDAKAQIVVGGTMQYVQEDPKVVKNVLESA